MTDITAQIPVALRRVSLSGIGLARLGALLVAIPSAVGEAFSMAYAAPYQGSKRPIAADGADQGRDPNW